MSKKYTMINHRMECGNEPEWKEKVLEKDYQKRIGMAMAWYRVSPYRMSDNKKWLLEYLEKEKYPKDVQSAIKKVPEGFCQISGVLARMMSRGCFLNKVHFKFWLTDIDKLKKNVRIHREEIVDDAKPRTSVQDKVKGKVIDCIGYVENQISEFQENNFKSDWLMYDWCAGNNIKGMITKQIGEHLQEECDNLISARDKTDEYMEEAYSNLSRPQLKKLIKFMETIISDCSMINSKKVRKTKTPKAKSPDKLVKHLNYLQQKENFKSVDPEKIIGAKELWVYNTKYRRITVYVAANDIRGLTVKGSTIKEYDEKESVRKSIRKPDEFFKVEGKRSMNKALKELTTKAQPINGRVDKHTILYKVF